MNQDFLNQRERIDARMKDIIKGNISNSDEVMKSEYQEKFEDDIRKGSVEVITIDDLKDSYGNKFFKGEDIREFENKLEELIEKGEKDYLTQDEYDALEKGRKDIDNLNRKAIAVPKGDGHEYVEIYVSEDLNG